MQVLDYGGYLERAARLFRDRPAVIDESGRVTWGELHAQAEALAVGLSNLGLQPGDRVVEIHFNSIRAVVVDFALALSGLVRVPINPRLMPDEIERMVSIVGPRAVVTTGEHSEAVARARAGSPSIEFVIADGVPGALSAADIGAARQGPRPVIQPDGLVTLRFTGGTSGFPKAVMAQQATQIGFSAMMLMDLFDIRRDDLVLQTQPYSHGGGNATLAIAMRGGGLLLQRKFEADAVLDAIETERTTILKLVPTVLHRLIRAQRQNPRDVSSLRLIVYGAAPMREELLHEAFSVFACDFAQIYGQAEAQSTIACLTMRDHEQERKAPTGLLRSVGRPFAMTDIVILDSDGSPLAADVVGEVATRGVLTADGYWNDPEMTRQKFRDGWVRSGDLGYLSEDGYLFLVGRASDMIISGGFNVYPAEVEATLVNIPGVREAAVSAVTDADWGERVVAAVICREGAHLTAQGVRRACRERLAGYKCPKDIQFVDELPLNVNGKVDRRALRELFAGKVRTEQLA